MIMVGSAMLTVSGFFSTLIDYPQSFLGFLVVSYMFTQFIGVLEGGYLLWDTRR
jgi:hypothetical protein